MQHIIHKFNYILDNTMISLHTIIIIDACLIHFVRSCMCSLKAVRVHQIIIFKLTLREDTINLI